MTSDRFKMWIQPVDATDWWNRPAAGALVETSPQVAAE
jgi:hypothetical protein